MTILETIKSAVDWTSIAVALGTIADVLPAVAATMSIIWLTIRIYETDTVKCWLRCYRRIEGKDPPCEK